MYVFTYVSTHAIVIATQGQTRPLPLLPYLLPPPRIKAAMSSSAADGVQTPA